MNASMIETQNREYSETLHHYNASVNAELVDFAKYYYRESLTKEKIKEVCSLSLEDKLWLLAQYKEELEFHKKPQLDDLY